jgi:multidrug resistance efflux pump
MELIVTIAYYFLVRLIFFDYRLLKFTMFWQFVVFGLYGLAALTEVVGLGQYAPYTETCFVQSYVVPMAPEYGGYLKKVYVESNEPVKKGDTLFQMDPSEWQYRVDEYEALLAAAGTNVAILSQQVEEARAKVSVTMASLQTARAEYEQIYEAAQKKAASQISVEQYTKKVDVLTAQLKADQAALNASQLAYESEIDGQPTEIAEAVANLEKARYNLKATTRLAPSDGFASYLQVFPGNFIRLKQPIMTFVNTEEQWIMTQITQYGIQNIRIGDTAEVALMMYPGKIFHAVVDEILWSNGNAQGHISGVLPKEQEIIPGMNFMVKLKMIEEEGYPIRFGASGIAAIYTHNAANILILLRRLEIQAESFLFYVYNPFV